MKKNQVEETKKLPAKEIKSKIADLEKSLVELKMQLKRGELSNLKEPKMIKRSIAQMKTILKEKSMLEAQK